MTTGAHHHSLNDWSPGGKLSLFDEFDPETGADLWVAEVDGKTPPRLFLGTPSVEKQATFSPNGKWVAYVSNQSGLNERTTHACIPRCRSEGADFAGGGEQPA